MIFGMLSTVHLPELSTPALGHTGIPRWGDIRRRRNPYGVLVPPTVPKINGAMV
jgi:hypothetical protein